MVNVWLCAGVSKALEIYCRCTFCHFFELGSNFTQFGQFFKGQTHPIIRRCVMKMRTELDFVVLTVVAFVTALLAYEPIQLPFLSV